MKNNFSKRLESYFADTVGKCFEVSSEKNIDSYLFAKEFLNGKLGCEILSEDYLKPYNSFLYMFDVFNDDAKITKGIAYDKYIMWMYGYLVKYWVYFKEIKPEDVWKILPIDTFKDLFSFYHTQGWGYIIEDATERYNSKNLRVK